MQISASQAQIIADDMKKSIGRDINIMNETGMIIASTNPDRIGQLHQGALRVLKERLDLLEILEDDPAQGVQQGINLPLLLQGKPEGVIGITGHPSEVSVFGHVIRRMTELMIENIQSQQQQLLAESTRALFIENWLFSPDPDWAELETRGRLLSLDPQLSYTVAILQPCNDEQKAMNMLSDGMIMHTINDHFKYERQNCCVFIRSTIILLLCQASRQGALTRVNEILNDVRGRYGLTLCAGVSGVGSGGADIRRRYLQARTAVSVAQGSSDHRVFFYDQVSLEFIADSVPAPIRQDLKNLIFAGCSEEEKSEFIKTIVLYFDMDGDIRRCAEALFVHRNTFDYRMKQLKKKTGCSLTIPRDALILYMVTR